MDHAYCTTDNRTYSAAEFVALGHVALEKRDALLCVECRQRAFFRAMSRDGKAACFGARPHAPGCELAAVEAGIWGTEGPNAEDRRWNSGDIVLTLARGTGAEDVAKATGAARRQRGRGRQFVNGNGDTVARQHKRLKPLLKLLLRVPEFSNSPNEIHIPSYGTSSIRNFFVSLEAVSDLHLNKFHGLWGTITSARWDAEQTLWLNTGGRDSMSFCMSEPIANTWLQSLRIDDLEEVAGTNILVLGKVRRSKNSKLYCPADNTALIAAIPATR